MTALYLGSDACLKSPRVTRHSSLLARQCCYYRAQLRSGWDGEREPSEFPHSSLGDDDALRTDVHVRELLDAV